MALGENPAQKGSHPVPEQHQFNARKKAIFLTELGKTGTVRGAASRAGVGFSTVYAHAQADQTFRDAIERARSEWEHGLVEKIVEAGSVGTVIQRRNGTQITEPGDWRALAWLLEHSPATREAYAGILRQKVEMGGSVDLPPVQVETTADINVGPGTMERLADVVAVLIRAGKLRLPDPGEMIDVTPPEENEGG